MKYLGVIQELKLTFWVRRWNQDISVESASVLLALPSSWTHAGLALQGGTTRALCREGVWFWSPILFQVQMKPNKNIDNLHEWKVQGEMKYFLRTQHLCSDFIFSIPCNNFYIYIYIFYFFFSFWSELSTEWEMKNPFFFSKCQKWDRLTLLLHLSPSTPPHPFPVLPHEILAKIDEIFHMWSKWKSTHARFWWNLLSSQSDMTLPSKVIDL